MDESSITPYGVGAGECVGYPPAQAVERWQKAAVCARGSGSTCSSRRRLFRHLVTSDRRVLRQSPPRSRPGGRCQAPPIGPHVRVTPLVEAWTMRVLPFLVGYMPLLTYRAQQSFLRYEVLMLLRTPPRLSSPTCQLPRPMVQAHHEYHSALGRRRSAWDLTVPSCPPRHPCQRTVRTEARCH